MNIFDKFTTGIDKKFGENTPYGFGGDCNDFSDAVSNKQYFTEFAQDLAEHLKNFNIINIRSIKSNDLGKLTTIKVTAKNKVEVSTIIKSVEEFCIAKNLRDIKNGGSLGELHYGYLKNGDYKYSIEYDFYVDIYVHKNSKQGYVMLIHADTL